MNYLKALPYGMSFGLVIGLWLIETRVDDLKHDVAAMQHDVEVTRDRAKLDRVALDQARVELDALALNNDRENAMCHARTACLRASLETLIKVWPGRQHVPETCGGWPEWPRTGGGLWH